MSEILKECVYSVLEEGIDFDYKTKIVSYNPSHENNVDTSIENNPTCDNDIIKGINVWSIFKRKYGNIGDGNPLIYALKGEGWKFRSEEDRENIMYQFQKICDKFISLYPIGVTIILPSGNSLNKYIADVIISKSKDAEIVNGVIRKITTEEVDDIVLYDDNCKFRQYYGDNFNSAYEQLQSYLEKMNKERGGLFSRHFIKDSKMRDILDITLKVTEDGYAKYAKKITDKDILIIDDTISRGQTIKEACKIMTECYKPKSITILTLMSRIK